MKFNSMFSKIEKLSIVLILGLILIFGFGMQKTEAGENGSCACEGTWTTGASCPSRDDWGEVSFSDFNKTGVCIGPEPLQCRDYDFSEETYDCAHQRFDPQVPEYTSGSLRYSLNDIEAACQGKSIGDSCTMNFTNVKCFELSGKVCDFTKVVNYGCNPGYTATCSNFDYSDDVCSYSKKTLGSSCTMSSEDPWPYSNACNCQSDPNDPPTAPTTIEFYNTNSAPSGEFYLTNDTLRCKATGAIDEDGDVLTYYYQFKNGGTIAQNWSTSYSFSCSKSGCDKGDTFYCHAKAHDGTVFGSEGSPDSIPIRNSLPIINTPSGYSISPGSSTTITIDGSDADNDDLTFSHSVTFYGTTPRGNTSFHETEITNTWEFTWSPVGTQPGHKIAVDFTVIDDESASDTGRVAITVESDTPPPPPNTPPSSRLVANETIAGNNETQNITITQGDTVTFSGMVWDCDDISNIQTKEHSLAGASWFLPAEDTKNIMNCSSGEKTFYPISNTETFDTVESFNRYISVSDEASTSTSTITITVQEPEVLPAGAYWSFTTKAEPECVCKYFGACGGEKNCLECDEGWRCASEDCSGTCDACIQDDGCLPEIIEPLIPFWREVLPKF